ncbi:metal-sulfur cluster assembly factor [Paenibacillus sp. FA6]|uniref:metal-sulfur cluster assembly factor n=1 Tax=Paenibacillus sp. FA6 TaxID=3413029 RepID=UPI003F658A42
MEFIKDCLKEVYDPELGVNIVDLGLIYDLQFVDGIVSVVMTLTTPGCPMHDMIVGGVKRALEALPEILSVEVEVVWEPAWSPSLMSDEVKEDLGYM